MKSWITLVLAAVVLTAGCDSQVAALHMMLDRGAETQILAIDFSAATPAEESLVRRLHEGTLNGIYAQTANRRTYPLPGYVPVRWERSDQTVKILISGVEDRPIEQPRTELTIQSSPFILKSGSREFAVRPSWEEGDILQVTVPVGPFAARLSAQPVTSEIETSQFRDDLLAGRSPTAPAATSIGIGGRTVTGRGITRIIPMAFLLESMMNTMSLPLASQIPVLDYDSSNGSWVPVSPSSLHRANFTLTDGSWLFDSEPRGATLRGLKGAEPTTTKTAIRVTNLPARNAALLSLDMEGYSSCGYRQMERDVVQMDGQEWIKLFCKLQKKP